MLGCTICLLFARNDRKEPDNPNNKRITEKITAILSEGLGVGGISKTITASKDEERIMIGALLLANSYGIQPLAPELYPINRNENRAIREHRTIIWSIVKTLEHHLSDLESFNFIKSPTSYQRFREIFFSWVPESYNKLELPLNITFIGNNKIASSSPPEELKSSYSLTKIKSEKQEVEKEISHAISELSLGMSHQDISEFFQILNPLPQSEKNLFLKQVKSIAGGSIGLSKIKIIKVLSSCNIEKRKYIVEFIKALAPRASDDTSQIIEFISQLNMNCEKKVNTILSTLKKANTNTMVCLESLKNMADENWEEFVNFIVKNNVNSDDILPLSRRSTLSGWSSTLKANEEERKKRDEDDKKFRIEQEKLYGISYDPHKVIIF